MTAESLVAWIHIFVHGEIFQCYIKQKMGLVRNWWNFFSFYINVIKYTGNELVKNFLHYTVQD